MRNSFLAISLLLLAVPVAAQDCAGDCSCDRSVTVDEVVALSTAALSGGSGDCPCGACPTLSVDVPCVVTAIRNALEGCPRPRCLGDCDRDGARTR